MQFTTITTALVGLFAASAIACGTPGEQCNNPNQVQCQCNAGNLVSCQPRTEGTGLAWRFAGDCAPNGTGLRCINGQCTNNRNAIRGASY